MSAAHLVQYHVERPLGVQRQVQAQRHKADPVGGQQGQHAALRQRRLPGQLHHVGDDQLRRTRLRFLEVADAGGDGATRKVTADDRPQDIMQRCDTLPGRLSAGSSLLLRRRCLFRCRPDGRNRQDLPSCWYSGCD